MKVLISVRDYWDHRRRELIGGVLFLGAILAAVVLGFAGVAYGWAVVAVFAAFVAGGVLLSDS